MSTDETYNGWTNRETWAVALHINNDQGWQESIHETVRNTLEGIEQDPPTYIDAGDITDAYYANTVGDAIRDNVEQLLTVDGYAEAFGGEIDRLPAELSRVAEDVGSLWRVDWTELGRAFIADVTDE